MPWSGRQQRSADERECGRNANFGLTCLGRCSQPLRQEANCSAAIVSAEYRLSLCSTRSTRSRAPVEGPSRQGPIGRRRTIKPEFIYASFAASSPEASPCKAPRSPPATNSCSASPAGIEAAAAPEEPHVA